MKNRYMNTIFTKHVINRLYNRGISQSDAYYTFKHPDGTLPGSTPDSKKFYKNHGSQRIEIVAKQNEKGEWIILTAWARKQGTGQPIFRQSQNEGNFLEKIIMKGLNRIDKFFKK